MPSTITCPECEQTIHTGPGFTSGESVIAAHRRACPATLASYLPVPTEAAMMARKAAQDEMRDRYAQYAKVDCTCSGTGSPFDPHTPDCARRQAWEQVRPMHHPACRPGYCQPACLVAAHHALNGLA